MNPHTSPPLSPSVASATEALQLAEQVLEEALTLGGDTSDARAAAQVARDALAALIAVEQQAAAQAAAAEREAAREADADALDAAKGEFVAVVSTVDAAPDAEPLPAPAIPSVVLQALLQALQQAQRAQRALAAAQVPYAAAAQEASAVRARLHVKEAALAEIRARRIGGDEQPGDAATMTALAMDAEDLRRIVGGLQAQVDAVVPAVQAAQQVLVDAQQAVLRAKSRAELDAMVERVRTLETHLVAQVRALRLAAQARGHSNFGTVFLPSQQLRTLAVGGWI